MIILGVTLSVLLVVAVGLAAGRKVHGDSSNLLVAGRSLALPFVAATLMGQAVDTNATLGNTDLSAAFGFWAGASLPLGLALCLLITGLLFAAPMNRMGLTTLPDFYRLRFGRGVEIASALLMMLAFAILVAGNLVAGGYLFEHFLGTSYNLGVLIIVGFALLYTVAGGMFADAYISVLQMGITLVGSVALLIWVAVAHGLVIPDGMGPFDLGQLTDGSQGAAINWATLVALGLGDIVAIDFMQRIFAAGSPQIARRACFVGAAGAAVIGIPYALVALASTSILPAGIDAPVLFVLLDDYAPAALTMLVLSGIVAASMSTADGAIMGTAAVAVRNVGGVRRTHVPGTADPLLRDTRLAMFPVVVVAVLFAMEVPETGVLLTLAFDLLLACLLVPFVLGLWWRRGTTAAALAAIVAGLGVRLVLFVLTPTMYGVDNTILYVDNDMVGLGFDGYPTFLAFAASLVSYVVVALVTQPAVAAGRDLRASEEGEQPEPVASPAPLPVT